MGGVASIVVFLLCCIVLHLLRRRMQHNTTTTRRCNITTNPRSPVPSGFFRVVMCCVACCVVIMQCCMNTCSILRTCVRFFMQPAQLKYIADCANCIKWKMIICQIAQSFGFLFVQPANWQKYTCHVIIFM